MTDQSETERLAKLIALWHGQKMIYRNKDGTQTVASSFGYGNWGDSPDRYMHAHWQEYTSAAERMQEELQTQFDLGFKAVGGTITPIDQLGEPALCEGCGVNAADPPSRLCPGCKTYQEHQL